MLLVVGKVWKLLPPLRTSGLNPNASPSFIFLWCGGMGSDT